MEPLAQKLMPSTLIVNGRRPKEMIPARRWNLRGRDAEICVGTLESVANFARSCNFVPMLKYVRPFGSVLIVGLFLALPGTLLYGGTCPPHEFYVGLTDMVYNPESRSYEITLKLFTDDLELALEGHSRQSAHKVALERKEDAVLHDGWIQAYAAAKFAVKAKDGTPLQLNWVGRETELDVTWIYLESPAMEPLKEVLVSNTMLMELYKDQSHVVHLKQGGRTRSALLMQSRSSATLKP